MSFNNNKNKAELSNLSQRLTQIFKDRMVYKNKNPQILKDKYTTSNNMKNQINLMRHIDNKDEQT